MKMNRFLFAVGVVLAISLTPSAVLAQQEQQDSIQQLQEQLLQMQLQLQGDSLSQQYSDLEQKAKVSGLIIDGLKRNRKIIQRESFSLSNVDREALYNEHRLKGAVFFGAINCFGGFGIGSYIQGNISGGIMQSLLDLFGYGFLTIGILVYNVQDKGYNRSDNEDDREFYREGKEEATTMIIASSIAIIFSRINSWILPFVYQNAYYNKMLRKSLNYDRNAYSLNPLIVPRQGGGAPALGLGFNVRY
jgi:hypothetical protein